MKTWNLKSQLSLCEHIHVDTKECLYNYAWSSMHNQRGCMVMQAFVSRPDVEFMVVRAVSVTLTGCGEVG